MALCIATLTLLLAYVLPGIGNDKLGTSFLDVYIIEPPRDKTNKMACAPTEPSPSI